MFHARSISRSPAERCCPSSAPRFSGVDAVLDEGHALLDPRLQRRLVRLEIHDRDAACGSTLMCLQQNRQRAPRDRPEADEQDSIGKCQHPAALRWSCRSIELLHQHLRVAAALLVFLAARGRQIVRRAFGEAALGLKISERLRRERQQLAQAQLARPVLDELDQLAADALILVRRADVQARQLALVLFRDRRAARRRRPDSCRFRR